MDQPTSAEIRTAVRKHYGEIASSRGRASCCGSTPVAHQTEKQSRRIACCASTSQAVDLQEYTARLGYTAEEAASVTEGSNLGLSCGNPSAIAQLREGESVLDLGSGAGFDSFLAAKQVGNSGHVIGVDMTPEMIEKSRLIAERSGYANVEFRLGEIEHLPVEDASIDVILSNCVINLSPDKTAVFREAYRVLKEGGRLAISDIVQRNEIPYAITRDVEMLTGCIGGAAPIKELTRLLREAGFRDIHITPREQSKEFIKDWSPELGVEHFIVSASIEATKRN